MAAVLALAAVGIGRIWRRPALIHALWLLVLLKLVTPPCFRWPVAVLAPPAPALSFPVEPPPRLRPPDQAAAASTPDPPPAPSSSAAEPLPALAAAARSGFPDPAACLRALAGVWLTGTLLWFSLAGLRLWR